MTEGKIRPPLRSTKSCAYVAALLGCWIIIEKPTTTNESTDEVVGKGGRVYCPTTYWFFFCAMKRIPTPSVAASTAVRRIEQVRRILGNGVTNAHRQSEGLTMRINATTLPVSSLAILLHPEKVPLPFLPYSRDGAGVPRDIEDLSQDTLAHLEWLMKRVSLGQDVFLTGPPPSFIRRNLVALFCGLANREVEYISLHRDLSAESDLKQRREIVRSGSSGAHVSVEWNDSVAVRAAVEGRILVIEGIERAERNVLTVLNNLLENREMNLEDGRHIVHPTRYDSLLSTHSKVEMDKLGLVRCHENFLVIALGLPVPPFAGNPLDPPFRSRFQVRYIPANLDGRSVTESEPTRRVKDIIQIINHANKDNAIGDETAGKRTLESAKSLLLPKFPETALPLMDALLTKFPAESKSIAKVLERVWPQSWIGKGLSTEQTTSLRSLIKQQGADAESNTLKTSYQTLSISRLSEDSSKAVVQFEAPDGSHVTATVSYGSRNVALELQARKEFIMTPRQMDLQTIMLQCHVLNQIPCLVGVNGSGKSTAIARFAEVLGYEEETINLYRDMTARDLIARRGTTTDGSTCWQESGLIQASLEGKIAVLDGIEWLSSGALASLQRFLEDGEVDLPNNSTLLRNDKFESIKMRCGFSDEEMKARRVFPMHPSFRVIAVANVPHSGPSASGNSWMNEEVAAMFHFVKVDEMDAVEERAIVQSLPDQARTSLVEPLLQKLLTFTHKYRAMTAHQTTSSSHLSTRQLIRIASRVSASGCKPGDLYTAIWRECLASFLPSLVRQSLEGLLKDSMIEKPSHTETLSIRKTDSLLHIGQTQIPVYYIAEDDAHARSLIPTSKAGPQNMANKGFYDNPLQTQTLRDLAIDFNLGEHLLLIGNQGVGKNKVTDRFLELINRPREYMQLHRDSTVSSLTATPTVENGLLVLKDSPLLRAIKDGRVLIIDEADKAPVMISACLKSLAENGEMSLVDGRKIRPEFSRQTSSHWNDERIIWMHKDFRMIILANRPGYPFMGNDFFSTIGESFSCHPIENPDAASEIALIQQAAPTVDKELIVRLVSVFGELRRAFDDGLVTYPYSLRELLNIVRHVAAYPEDSLGQTIRNVFDFDLHRPDIAKLVQTVFRKHGLDVTGFNNVSYVGLGKPSLVLSMENTATKSPPKIEAPKHGQVDPENKPHVGGSNWAGGTGGSNTAGLGGRGGPYRLSSGNPVHQVSDEEKSKVPQNVLEAARKMGKDALEKRLAEISMNPFEADMYVSVLANVKDEVRKLRVILEGVKSREKERVWIKNQTIGELDDGKLVEGIAGETAIFKSRGEEVQDFSLVQKKPKRVKVVFDVSGSMYRFNGFDGRLNRSLETALMIMEAMDESFRSKFVYDIVGHSGDSTRIDLVKANTPPKNELERLRVLQAMSAHSQYCWSGDNTVSSTRRAIQDVALDEADEHFVIILSDANLRRYGITAQEVSLVLESDPKVQAAIVFIGSLGDEAQRLVNALPRGKAFLALDTSKIPSIIKELFASIAN
ncbi:AAA domain-containing protein [Chytriomyces sp. MP71]|nr:AAA domain-containing protein [Chytriomyces sp. MP71]